MPEPEQAAGTPAAPSFRDTLCLPRTGFAMRAGLAAREPEQLARWQADDLSGQIARARAGAPRFLLHDGPPYANGALHNGHVLNKVLKDIVIKDRTMAGLDAPYVPGWDCHGLPIEAQVDRELGARRAQLNRLEVRAACRAYAAKAVAAQRESFRRLGVFGAWDRPYLTMDPAYEAATLRALADIARRGLLYRGLRPVNWCTTHQTALAEAELEYETVSAPSAYVALAAVPGGVLPAGAQILIWTTTPWTLPANVAVAVHPEMAYVAYRTPAGATLVVAEARLAHVLADLGQAAPDAGHIVGRWPGAALVGTHYRCPLRPADGVVLPAAYVSDDAGTGCVHTAPGHGADDFDLGRAHALEILGAVDGRGRLTAAAGPFAGLELAAGNAAILDHLAASGALWSAPTARIDHRAAHCWRCHRPLLQRATEQWFMALDRPFSEGGTLRERALAALPGVRWLPARSVERMAAMLRGRPDWCLSRQRTWGVPLAVVTCTRCERPHVDPDAMDRVAARVADEGAEAWWSHPVAAFFGDLRCPKCGGDAFRKEQDILDVWFDSGVSYAAVMAARGLTHPEGAPVDLYLEGSDQHRGWFHAALLLGEALGAGAPYRAVLTHGFVVDGHGRKLSKSRGNFVDPAKLIARDGAELMRLWVAAEDYHDDVRLSDEILTRTRDTYRKVRNTLRFLLGNLADFDFARDAVAPAALDELDAVMLAASDRVAREVRAAYAAYDFHAAVQALLQWCAQDLSAFYLDVRKDCLYAAAPTGQARRSAQTVLHVICRDLIRLFAPVLCFTAEEAWEQFPKGADDPTSVHLARYPGAEDPAAVIALRAAAVARTATVQPHYVALRAARREVNAALELARRSRTVGSSTDAKVVLSGGAAALAPLAHFDDAALATAFIVSELCRENGGEGTLTVRVERAAGSRCARCWLYRPEVGAVPAHPELCQRCAEIV